MASSVKVEICVIVFDADKIFMFDTDKHYFASKLTTDMSVYVWPTYTMYAGIMLFQCYPSNMSYVGPTLRQHVGLTEAQRAS